MRQAAELLPERGGGSLSVLALWEADAPGLQQDEGPGTRHVALCAERFRQGTRPAIDFARSGPLARFEAPLGGWGAKLATWVVHGQEILALAGVPDPEGQPEDLARERRWLAQLLAALDQPPHQPVPLEEQVAIVYAVLGGHAQGLRQGEMGRYQEELRGHLRAREHGLLAEIRAQEGLRGPLKPRLSAALRAFQP